MINLKPQTTMNFNQARIQDFFPGVVVMVEWGVGGVHFSQKEFHITFYFTCVIFFSS
jgi:hypothetical protein